MRKIVMQYWILLRYWLFFVLWIHGLQCNNGIVSWCLVFLFLKRRFPVHAWGNSFRCITVALCHQLSPCFLNEVFVFFVTRINRINASQFSGVVEFRFLDCQFLFFSSLSSFEIFVSHSPDTHILLEAFLSMWIFLVLHPNRFELAWWLQMTLLTRIIELSVWYVDGK